MRPVLVFVALLAALILWFTWSRDERGAEFVLPLAGSLSGVVRREDGTPVAGASLFLREGDEWKQVGQSARDGSFALGTLPAGPAVLGATAARLSTRDPLPVEIVEGVTTRVEVTLVAFTEGRLRVNGTVDGPVSVSWTDDRGETRVLEATPGEDLPLGTLFAGRHRFSAEAGPQGARCLAIVRGDEPELEVVLSLD